MVRGMSRGGCSGQVLVIAVLIVSLVLLSTQVYIFEVGRPLEGSNSARVNDFVLAVKLGSKHVIAGSLANISTGGDNAVLQSNLQSWTSFLGSFYQLGRPVLNYTFRNSDSYVNSTRVSWGAEGFGITSAYVNFNFCLRDGQISVQMPFALNVSSSLFIEGGRRTLQGDMMQVNVTCHVLNEGVPALAESVMVLYEKSGVWLRADAKDSFSFADYGNGTCLIIFEQEYLPSETVNVSAQVYDLRSVYIQANTTCNEAT